jgi:uncharacterized protein (TIGR00290 family)
MTELKPKAFISWSSGKDSAYALLAARRLELAEIVGVLTTVNGVHDRVSMHGVRNTLLDLQVAALGLQCVKVPLPSPCSNQEYENRMTAAVERIKAQGVRHVVFGDLFLEDIRAYREERLAAADMTGIFPLWRRDTRALAEEMMAGGIIADLVVIDPRKLDRAFAGRRFDRDLLAALPAGVDPCGENGEFHTFVSSGPMFSAPIAVTGGQIVERDGFVFADMVPTSTNHRSAGPVPCPVE